MKPLFKTTIVIWSDFDPSHCDIECMAHEATQGEAYCSASHVERVEDPSKDKDWDNTEFFDSPDDEDNYDDSMDGDHESALESVYGDNSGDNEPMDD